MIRMKEEPCVEDKGMFTLDKTLIESLHSIIDSRYRNRSVYGM